MVRKISELLQSVFDGSHPRYTTYQFENMINVGLVLMGIKKGAIVDLDPAAIAALKHRGVHVSQYPLIPKLSFVSLKDPHLGDAPSHIEVGKQLGYITPYDIFGESLPAHRTELHIRVKFRRVGGRPHEISTLSQIVVDKTMKQIRAYIEPFVRAIRRMEIPPAFELLECEAVIEPID